MRGFFGRGVYNGVETQPGGGEDVQEQEMIAQLLQQDERGMEALLLHYGPLMRYIIAPILPDPQAYVFAVFQKGHSPNLGRKIFSSTSSLYLGLIYACGS